MSLTKMNFNGRFRRLSWFFRRHSWRASCLAISVVLVIFLTSQWLQKTDLLSKKKELSETLTIYRQMRAYSDSVCRANAADEDNLVIRGAVGVVDVANSEIVPMEVTFILISQLDLACANDRLKELREEYPSVKVIVAFQGMNIAPKEQNVASFPFLKDVINLGGFQTYPEALQNAIPVVKTKYFMTFDSQLAFGEMQPRFVEKLLASIPGFDILGGSEVSLENEFQIPCHRLKLRNWTFFETFEYHVLGDSMLCDSTSVNFLANAESFTKALELKTFDASAGVMWKQDFFIRAKGLLVVGVLPEIIFKKIITATCQGISSGQIEEKKRIDDLLPFVNKYHVLDFISQDGNQTTICDGSDPMVCSEKYIFPKWKLLHWAYSGLTAFPFVIERLVNALHFGTAQLDKAGFKYVLEGGTLLGFIKVRAVLPWDSGDVDTFVFSNRRPVINLVKKIEQMHGYEYLLRWNAFHVYVTPCYAAHDGLIVYALNRNEPEELVYIRLHGKLFPAPRTLFRFIREYYGPSYMESRIRFGDERVSCDYKGYQACMPDCRWDGCGSGRQQFPGILS